MRRTAPPCITLLTDFGWADSYVAEMRGVIERLAPGTHVIDAAHDVPPGNVRSAAWILSRYWSLWPRGTIHIAVVDPGVGTRRAILLARADGRWLLAPDNGLLTGVKAAAGSFIVCALRPNVRRPAGCSRTFHGRDIFAVAAARLVSGECPDRLAGPPLPRIVCLDDWSPRSRPGGRVEGRIVHVDRFGNLITNLGPEHLPRGRWRLRIGRAVFDRLHGTFGDVAPGEELVYIGSAGRLEVAVRDGSAFARHRAGSGAKVVVVPGGTGHRASRASE